MKQSVFGSKRGSLIQQKTKFCPFFEFCLEHKLLIKPFLVNPKRLLRFIIKLVLKAKKSWYIVTCNFPTSEILQKRTIKFQTNNSTTGRRATFPGSNEVSNIIKTLCKSLKANQACLSFYVFFHFISSSFQI